MTDLMREATESFGPLLAVIGASNFASEADPVRYDEYVFQFEHGSLRITSEPEDDTIVLHDDGSTLPLQEALTNAEPWRRYVGFEAAWMWVLRNSRGYTDGYQIEFARSGATWTVQLISEGGALTVRTLSPIGQEE